MFKLTTLSRGGGCGCKIAPQTLAKIIAGQHLDHVAHGLLIGNDTLDDAAVYGLNDRQAIVATTDFFTPIVDDARDFGRIAAANAISDIYAMGGMPSFALNILGMPVDKIPAEIISEILAGGTDICRAADIAIGGGHSIDTTDPIYGLAVIGTVDLQHIKRNSQAQVGDVLILGKPLGIGVLSAALRKGKLTDDDYQALLAQATQLNKVGEQLGTLSSVHAMTDVSGFGLLGHLSEMCQGACLDAAVIAAQIPVIPAAEKYARQGIATGAAGRNQEAYCNNIHFDSAIPRWRRDLFFDPQTNGGLLVACAPENVSGILSVFKAEGFDSVAEIGMFGSSQRACVTVS